MPKPNLLKFKAPLGYRIALISSWAFFFFMFFIIFVRDSASLNYSLAKVAIGTISILLILGILLFNHISKTIVIENDSIQYSSLLKNVQIPLKEIKGYKSSRYSIIVKPQENSIHPTIRMTKNAPLYEWLSINMEYLGLAWF